MTALRSAISLDEPYAPPGGLPEKVRVNRGKDFLSAAVRSTLGVSAVGLKNLPGYTPHLKGSVETFIGAAKTMLFAGLPRYTAAPTLTNRRVADSDAPALTFEVFVVALLNWVR